MSIRLERYRKRRPRCIESARRDTRSARVFATPTVASAPQRRMKPNTCGRAFLLTRPRSLRVVNPEASFVRQCFVVNAHETICLIFTVPLPCFFSFCLVGTRQIPLTSYKKGFKKNGTASNRSRLSEISASLAASELDGTRPAAFLSA
jgi:hypothetical protein